MLDLAPLPESLYPRAFALEPGDETYERWYAGVTSPAYQNFGIYRGDVFCGYLGLQRTAPGIVEFHLSLERKALHPIETARIVTQTGIYLFQQGIQELRTIHLTTNRAACRLAKACGMPLQEVLTRGDQPHCLHILHKQTYEQNPMQWEF